jgi:SAM-dependent methyltransferase
MGEENVAQWQTLFDETYGATDAAQAPSFVGWNSSYTGAPIPASDMEEWLAGTVERIAGLAPDRVLEIGCGVGLLLQHLAPISSVYRGTDISSAAISGLREWAKTRADLAHVELAQREATALSDMEPRSVDTVIINSVAQYFPDIDYLRDVLAGAVALVGDGGRIFVGDLRHFGLLATFHASIQVARATAGSRAGELNGRAASAAKRETELAVDPGLFLALQEDIPRISAVEILLKRGRSAACGRQCAAAAGPEHRLGEQLACGTCRNSRRTPARQHSGAARAEPQAGAGSCGFAMARNIQARQRCLRVVGRFPRPRAGRRGSGNILGTGRTARI